MIAPSQNTPRQLRERLTKRRIEERTPLYFLVAVLVMCSATILAIKCANDAQRLQWMSDYKGVEAVE